MKMKVMRTYHRIAVLFQISALIRRQTNGMMMHDARVHVCDSDTKQTEDQEVLSRKIYIYIVLSVSVQHPRTHDADDV